MSRFSRLFRKEGKEGVENQLYRMLYNMIGDNVALPKYKGIKEVISDAYLINDKIYAIITRIVAANNGVPWEIYEVKDKRKARSYHGLQSKHHRLDIAMHLKEQAFEPIVINELEKLFTLPNDYETINELEGALSSFYLLTGNAYLYTGVKRPDKYGAPLSLHAMPSHITEIVPSGNILNPIKGYRVEGWYKDFIEREDVGHIKMWNPEYSQSGSQLYGMPPLRAAWKVLGQDNEAVNAMFKAFYNTGAYGILSGEKGENWTPQQAKQVRKMWRDATGSNNFRKLVFASEPVKWTQIGVSPVDLAIISARKMTLRDLCNIYKVPAELLNDPEGSTYNNMKEARKGLITDAALPLKETIKGLLQRHVVDKWGQALGKELYLDFDLNAYLELQDDLDGLYTRMNMANWITANEKREVTGFEKLSSSIMDEPLLPAGYIPASIYGMDYGEGE